MPAIANPAMDMRSARRVPERIAPSTTAIAQAAAVPAATQNTSASVAMPVR